MTYLWERRRHIYCLVLLRLALRHPRSVLLPARADVGLGWCWKSFCLNESNLCVVFFKKNPSRGPIATTSLGHDVSSTWDLTRESGGGGRWSSESESSSSGIDRAVS